MIPDSALRFPLPRSDKVLIVDDDDDLRLLLLEFLADEGYEVRAAEDGEDGLRVLHDVVPDIILLDVQMPKLDGPGMALRMFIADAGMDRIPIILLSGNSDLALVARTVGTVYFLTKPTTTTIILRMIERGLRERIAPTPPGREHR